MSTRTVAVAPFRSIGSDEYAFLGTAFESMLIDNLSMLPDVQVLDREHVKDLIDEARLAGSDAIGDDAAIRAGTLLTGGRFSDWTASPTHLRLEAVLVDVDAGTTITHAHAEALATEFYNLVPGLAQQFASALGLPLDTLASVARQKIEQRHTESIKAALLFGEALEALDREDLEAARKACTALEKEDADFPLAKRKCAYIPLEWPALPSVVGAVEPTETTSVGTVPSVAEGLKEQATEPRSYKKYALLGATALLLIGGGAGGYLASRDSGSSPNSAPPPGGNSPPTLQGVGDRSVPAGDTVSIDMRCFDPGATATTIQNTSAGPNSSFNQTSGNPASGHYRQNTNANQAGQVFNVAFVCTDNGSPPASDTKTARISLLEPLTKTASPTPTATLASTPTVSPTAAPTASPSSSPSTSPSPSPSSGSIPTRSPSPSPRPR
jgi:hypothetical protein